MEPEMPDDLDRLLRRAAEGPQHDVSVQALWRRSRRRRTAKLGLTASAAACLSGVALFVATGVGRHSAPEVGLSSPPSSVSVESRNPALCSPASAESRLRTLVNELNVGSPNLVNDSIAAPSRLEFFQLPGFEQPSTPSMLRPALAAYFHGLFSDGDRFSFVSLTAGPIDSAGNRGFSYRLTRSVRGGPAQPAAGTGSVDCYAGKVAALYAAW